MRVVKDLEQGLLVNFFQYKGKDHLAVTILTFFDLDAPERVLQETALWPFVQAELGQDAVLDMGLPKPSAEVLLHARCYAPGESPLKAHTATFRVGAVEKTLAVFGDRRWTHKPGAGWVMNEPAPFAVMDIGYARAFGGKDYAQNPLGRGFVDPQTRKEHEDIPAPNILAPDHYLGSPDDKPEPAGFGPLDITWPQRASKLGTYDENWMQTRWPGYPDDLDWSAFNAAPLDQRVHSADAPFFHGDEQIGLLNMHPERPSIASKLPGLRQRCFINLLDDWRNAQSEASYLEIPTRLDTVWLFPHALRGAAVFRGVVETKDDEGLDVAHLHIATEALNEEPKPIEHYYEVFKKRLDRGVEVDMKPFEEAKLMLAEAREKIADVPRMVNDALARMLGKAPKPVLTPEDTVAQSLALIEKQKIQLADAAKNLAVTKAQYGHLVKIDLSGLAKASAKLDALGQKLAGMVPEARKKVAAGLDAAQQKAKDAYNKALKTVGSKYVEGKGADPDALFEALRNPPRDRWQESGMRFLYSCRAALENDAPTMAALKRLGLTNYTVRRHWLGLNLEEQRLDPALWGLEKELPNQELVLPAGFLIPCFENADLVRIRFRPFDPLGNELSLALTDASKDSLLAKSKEGETQAMVLSAGPGKPFVRVKDDLEAILLAQESADVFAVAALIAPELKMDKESAKLCLETPQFLIILYPKERETPLLGIQPWRQAHLQVDAILLPVEAHDLFSARVLDGVDLWTFVTNPLRPGLAPDVSPRQRPENGPNVPVFDVKAMIQQVKDATMAKAQPKLDKLEEKKAAGMAKISESLKKMGKDPEQILKTGPPTLLSKGNPYEAPRKKMAEAMANARKQLSSVKQLTPELDAKLSQIEASNSMVLDKAEAMYASSMPKLAAAKEQLKDPIPAWSKKMLADAGFDPEDRNPLRLLTRAEVVERHAAGLSLAGKNMSGVDLSKLDLSGIDMRKAFIEKTDFTDSILDNADLSNCIGNEAIFAGASLNNARLLRGILVKAKFPKAKLRGAVLEHTLLKEADLSEADFTDARTEQTLFEKAVLKKARFTSAQARLGYFLDADCEEASFVETDLSKAVFLRAPVKQADFTRATMKGAIFLTATGEKVNFSGANMFNTRILQGCALPNANFSGADARRASFMDSGLEDANFQGARVDEALIEHCQLPNAQLAGVSAKQTRFNKSDLNGANLSGVNLLYGSLRKAKLPNATLAGANLYSAEFYRTGVGKTDFEGANLKMTKLAKFASYLEKEQDS